MAGVGIKIQRRLEPRTKKKRKIKKTSLVDKPLVTVHQHTTFVIFDLLEDQNGYDSKV
jgi:hypothetical protein